VSTASQRHSLLSCAVHSVWDVEKIAFTKAPEGRRSTSCQIRQTHGQWSLDGCSRSSLPKPIWFDKLSLFVDLSVQAIRSTLCYWYLFWGTSLRQVAGAVASSLTNPLDVVKTRVMTQTRGGNVVHGGLRSIAKQIWMEEVKTHSFQTLCVANCLCNSFCSPCALCTLCARLQHFPLDIYHALWHGKHLHFDMLAGTEGVWSRYSSPSSLQGAAAYCLNLFVVCETWGVQLGLDNLEDYGYMDYIHYPCIIAWERWNMSQFVLHFNFQNSSMTRL
jgi:hypothetical protein